MPLSGWVRGTATTTTGTLRVPPTHHTNALLETTGARHPGALGGPLQVQRFEVRALTSAFFSMNGAINIELDMTNCKLCASTARCVRTYGLV